MNPERLIEKAVDRVTRKKFVSTVEWESAFDPAEVEGNGELLADALRDASVDGSWQDHGLGSYGSSYSYVVEDAQAVVRFVGVGQTLVFPAATKVRHSGGGCEGEHPGPCRGGCVEWEVTINWKPVHSELRGADLYVVCEGDQV